jgi:hypothetical protein
MQRYTVYSCLEKLYVSAVTSAHQLQIQLNLQHLVFVTPLLLSAAVMDVMEQA